jgi:hypothetical protein
MIAGSHMVLSSIFTFAMDAALVEFNPCNRLKMRGAAKAGRAFSPMTKSD